ncbi:MAG: hypothetical protein ABI450_10825 [Rhizomicrobium sp.]
MMDIDRRAFIASLGGASAVAAMSSEAKADALEDHQNAMLNKASEKFPTKAELEAEVETMPYRRGVGNLWIARQNNGNKGNVKRLQPMPEAPTLTDYFRLRFGDVSSHVLQSANRAMKTGMSEEVILACLLHDTVQQIVKVDHGWWGAQMYAPYLSEKATFAIRYHQALRFYDDPAHGYKYPDLYRRLFGEDYKPEPYIDATYKYVRAHKWYEEPRLVTVNDLYAFEPGVNPKIEQFTDIIGRNFKQPKEGLGFDNSPSAHMWRTLAMPDHPL